MCRWEQFAVFWAGWEIYTAGPQGSRHEKWCSGICSAYSPSPVALLLCGLQLLHADADLLEITILFSLTTTKRNFNPILSTRSVLDVMWSVQMLLLTNQWRQAGRISWLQCCLQYQNAERSSLLTSAGHSAVPRHTREYRDDVLSQPRVRLFSDAMWCEWAVFATNRTCLQVQLCYNNNFDMCHPYRLKWLLCFFSGVDKEDISG